MNYIVSWPYAFSGSDSAGSSALSGAFGRTFFVRDPPYVTNCTASTTVASSLSPGYLVMTASGFASAPATYGSQVSFHGTNSASFSYEFELSLPASARVSVGAPHEKQTVAATLGRVGSPVPIVNVYGEAIDTTVALEPGRYFFNGYTSQDTYNFYQQGPEIWSSTFGARFELRVSEEPPPCPEPWYALSTPSGLPEDLVLQDLSQVDDVAAMAALQQHYRQSAQRLRALARAARAIPSDLVHGVQAAAEGLAIDQAIQLAPRQLRPVLDTLNRAVSVLEDGLASEVADYYKSALANHLMGGAALFEQLADSLPDPNHGSAEYGCFQPSDLGLFDDPNSPLAQAFSNLRSALDDLEFARRALARTRGALAAGDASAYAAQRRAFVAVLTSADRRLLDAADALSQARSSFPTGGVPDSAVDSQLLRQVRDEIRTNGLSETIREDLTKLGLDSSDIDEVEDALANLDVELPVSQAFDRLYELTDATITELRQGTARAQLSAITSPAPVPANNPFWVAALLTSLLSIGAIAVTRRRGRPNHSSMRVE